MKCQQVKTNSWQLVVQIIARNFELLLWQVWQALKLRFNCDFTCNKIHTY